VHGNRVLEASEQPLVWSRRNS